MRNLAENFKTYTSLLPRAYAVGEISHHKETLLTRAEYYQTIGALALALRDLGLQKQDKVAIIAATCFHWHLADLAIMMSRGITVPIYPSYIAEQVHYIAAHSEAKMLFVENAAQWKKYLEIQERLPLIKVVIHFKNITYTPEQVPAGVTVLSFAELLARGKTQMQTRSDEFAALLDQVQGEDVATIIYTSGTTGEPKGAIITQHAFSCLLENANERFNENDFWGPKDRSLTFLPLSHVLGRFHSVLHLRFNMINVFCCSLGSLMADLQDVRPGLFIGVPRIFDMFYQRLQGQIEQRSPRYQRWFKKALQWSNTYFDLKAARLPIGLGLRVRQAIINQIFLKKIQASFGGKLKIFVTGGAPIPLHIHKFIRNCGLTVLEGYGLTETIAPCAANRTNFQIPGTVGPALQNTEIKIAPDGEILIKTEAMFSGYYKNESATAEAIKDGFFYSGDVGFLDQNGYLTITDRKKDIIVTLGGKNVAPQMIENLLKTCRYIAHAVVLGDNRKFLVAVISLNKESFTLLQDSLKLPPNFTAQDLVKSPAVNELMEKEIARINQNLAQFEMIHKFVLVPEEFSIAGGQLTPSMKVRRKFVAQSYGREVEALYQ